MQYLKNRWELKESEDEYEANVVNVYPEIERQKILGFGGAFTEAAAYMYSRMPAELKEQFMEACFGESGNRYSLGRVHMGSCDFALAPYSESYRPDLSDFNIEQDKKYIIPMIRDALKKAGRKFFLLASPWSPPAFMKDTGELNHAGKLKPEFYGTYAEYFAKFILAYRAEGIEISAVTVQNEARAKQNWESCRWTATEEAVFATNYLRPTLDKNGLQDVKIMIWDHNKERVLNRADESFAVPGAREAIWGLGYHWYSGEHFDNLALFREKYPEKEILETEFCSESCGNFDDDKRTRYYANEYIRSLRFGSAGLCDWNLLLNPAGGPYHWRQEPGGCSAAFYYDEEKKELIQDGIYGAINTVVSQLDRGDRVIAISAAKQNVPMVAVKKMNGTVILFVLNASDEKLPVALRMGKKAGLFFLPPMSVSANTIC